MVTSGLKEEVGGSLDLLETLITQYFVVTDKTTSLHLSYQHLLEVTKLVEVDRELGERLMMF